MRKETRKKLEELRKIFPLVSIRSSVKDNSDPEYNSLVVTIVNGNIELSSVEVPYVKSQYQDREAYGEIMDFAVSAAVDTLGLDGADKEAFDKEIDKTAPVSKPVVKDVSEPPRQSSKPVTVVSESVAKKPVKVVPLPAKNVASPVSELEEEVIQENKDDSSAVSKLAQSEDVKNTVNELLKSSKTASSPSVDEPAVDEDDDSAYVENDSDDAEPDTSETRRVFPVSIEEVSEENDEDVVMDESEDEEDDVDAADIDADEEDEDSDSMSDNELITLMTKLYSEAPNSSMSTFTPDDFIQSIGDPYRQAFTHVTQYGYYNGKTLQEVERENPSCIEWMANQKRPIAQRKLTLEDIQMAKLIREFRKK